MNCLDAILSTMLALPVWHLDADMTRSERMYLYTPTAETICRVGANARERSWLLAQAWSETKFAAHVVEGRCLDGPPGVRCDEGRATTEWQVHGHCREAWSAPTLEERRDAGARCALATARHGLTVCGLGGSFGFQTGRRVCSRAWIDRRVRLYRWILARLEDEGRHG